MLRCEWCRYTVPCSAKHEVRGNEHGRRRLLLLLLLPLLGRRGGRRRRSGRGCRGGRRRCGGRCDCYCETAAPWTGKSGSASLWVGSASSCDKVEHSSYDLYMYVQDKPAAGSNEYKEEIAGLRSAVQSCAASTARDLAAKDAQLQAQNKQLAARDAEVASLRSALAAKSKEAADAKGELGALRKWRATLSERITG